MTPKLYFAPLACSLATRIACYEAGIAADYVQVDTRKKRLVDGTDYLPINPMGQVPVLEIEPGVRLTENAAVLQWVADQAPESGLAPANGLARIRLQQWLSFIGTELHKAVFVPLLDSRADPAVKAYARDRAGVRLDVLETHLSTHAYLVDDYSVADGYLAVVLNWAAPSGVDLTGWPAVHAWHRRMLERPSIARAVREEFALYRAEQKAAAA